MRNTIKETRKRRNAVKCETREMLHIDTCELHPGLIMSACRSSRNERERERERGGNAGRNGKENEEEEAEEDEEEEEEAGKERRGRERSNKRCSLGCRAGLRCLSRSTSLPPVPLFVVPDVPPSPPVLAEKERALGNPVLRSVASTLCVLLLLGCTHSGVATVSVLRRVENMTGSIANESSPHCAHFRNIGRYVT